MLDLDELRNYFHYDPDTGKFSRNGHTFSNRRPDGYIQLKYKGHMIRAARLALALKLGRWPECVDHVNQIHDDDRICNLREVTQAENIRYNSKIHKDNTSGKTGVSFDARRNRWYARIVVNRKTIYLGSFKTRAEAVVARQRVENPNA